MIRRDAQLADGSAAWVLISQIEHARISAQLAALCAGRFGADQAPDDIRREVLAAIAHHDDGWADWERSPRLHLKSGKPVSFMELEPCEAMDIWTMSIVASMEDHGLLAAWIIAGHFIRLLKSSEHARSHEYAGDWYAGMQEARNKALAEWQSAHPSLNASWLAEEALQWLWTFDEVSLWFCCTCPAAGESRLTQRSSPNAQGRVRRLKCSSSPGRQRRRRRLTVAFRHPID